MPNKTIRIGGGQGFWGDWLEAPLQLVEKGDIDYLVLDYLAEVTMSILAKQKERDPALGYVKDFPLLIHELAPHIKDKKVKIIANAGGLNPKACAQKCLELLSSIPGMNSIPTIAVVTGDDVLPRKEELEKKGVSFSHLENSSPISSINHSLKSMNAYIGGASITEALKNGADIVITGRVADPCMTLAALAYEFSWDYSNWDLLASGVIAGHVIECGAHVTGGNFSGGWEHVPDAWNIGFPIIECSEDGSFVVTKPENTGGLVTVQTVSEQLIYEIGDPEHYITPDVIADFTSITLIDLGNNKVKVSPAKGKPKPSHLKISASYFDGYSTEGTLVLPGPHTLKKAAMCEDSIRRRVASSNIIHKELHFEALGAFDSIPGMREKLSYPEPGEVVFRSAIHTKDKKDAQRFSREITPLVLSGPSGITGYAGGKREVREVYAYFPTLIPREFVSTSWEFVS